MPKYVLKEDVEKGLVDPTKPLAQQPQYKEKIDKQAQEKNKLHEDKKPLYQRPKKERPPRNPRPTFNYDRKEITLETKVPEKPKHLLERPNKEKHNEGLDKLKAQREALKQQRKNLIQEQRNIIRDVTESRKTGKLAINQYSGAMRDKFNIENQLRKQIKILDDHKKKVNSDMQGLKHRADQLRKSGDTSVLSIEALRQKIAEKEHYLTSGDINKRQQAKLFNQINQLKRNLHKARPDIEIQSELGKLSDHINILYRQLKTIKTELHIKITEANNIKAELDGLKEQRKSEEGHVEKQLSVQEIKAQYEIKIKAVDARRDKLEDKIDDYIDAHLRAIDNYQDQVDALKYRQWVQDQIEYLKKKKLEAEIRKKEQDEYEKRKLKEKQQYEKRKQERKKYEEQKKAKQEQRKLRLQKQRLDFINRNPNEQLIDLCETLLTYCQNLKPSAKVQQKKNKQQGELKLGKQWQKQIKGGATVILSKKTKLDEDLPKKQPKQKKKQEDEDEGFTHGIQTINHFQLIKLLPPANLNEIDSTMKLIQDKLVIYNNPSEQEKIAFKEKAIKEFDEKHSFRDHKQNHYKQKGDAEVEGKNNDRTEKPRRKEKKELSEQDFPGLA